MGGSGGTIIVGDELVGKLILHSGKVAVFRVQRMIDIIKKYHLNENSIDQAEQLFLLRCACDIVDNA